MHVYTCIAPPLQAGARLRVRDNTGVSPLHTALGSLPVLRRLLGKLNGVDGAVSLDAQDNEGRTALHLAVGALDAPLATALLRAGASVGLVDSAGLTHLRSVRGPSRQRHSPLPPRPGLPAADSLRRAASRPPWGTRRGAWLRRALGCAAEAVRGPVAGSLRWP